jgi:hypothetical protein
VGTPPQVPPPKKNSAAAGSEVESRRRPDVAIRGQSDADLNAVDGGVVGSWCEGHLSQPYLGLLRRRRAPVQLAVSCSAAVLAQFPPASWPASGGVWRSCPLLPPISRRNKWVDCSNTG